MIGTIFDSSFPPCILPGLSNRSRMAESNSSLNLLQTRPLRHIPSAPLNRHLNTLQNRLRRFSGCTQPPEPAHMPESWRPQLLTQHSGHDDQARLDFPQKLVFRQEDAVNDTLLKPLKVLLVGAPGVHDWLEVVPVDLLHEVVPSVFCSVVQLRVVVMRIRVLCFEIGNMFANLFFRCGERRYGAYDGRDPGYGPEFHEHVF
jgi:hypothetical protein